MKQTLTEVLERAFRNEAVILKNYPQNPKAFYPTKTLRTRVKVALRRCTIGEGRLTIKETSPAGAPWFSTDRVNVVALLMALDIVPGTKEDARGNLYVELEPEAEEILTAIKSIL